MASWKGRPHFGTHLRCRDCWYEGREGNGWFARDAGLVRCPIHGRPLASRPRGEGRTFVNRMGLPVVRIR